MKTKDRFWSKVDKSGGPNACWIWMAGRNARGYGRFYVGIQCFRAHRFAYELAHGPIPDGLHGLHRCDNPPCCNPSHIFVGTHADNMADRSAKGRQARGERNGQTKLSDDEVAEIRRMYADKKISQREIGRLYGVSGTTIMSTVLGRIHVGPVYASNLSLSERNYRAKLSRAQVGELRAAYAAGGITQAELGRRYGIKQAAVSSIIVGRTWSGPFTRHIADTEDRDNG